MYSSSIRIPNESSFNLYTTGAVLSGSLIDLFAIYEDNNPVISIGNNTAAVFAIGGKTNYIHSGITNSFIIGGSDNTLPYGSTHIGLINVTGVTTSKSNTTYIGGDTIIYDKAFYLGDKDTEGSWRIKLVNGDLEMAKYTGNTYVIGQTITIP